MTKSEFNEHIERYKQIAKEERITLPTGSNLPDKFWAVFLGISESTYYKMKGNSEDNRTVQSYTAKHVMRINLLSRELIIQEILKSLDEYLQLARDSRIKPANL